MTISPNNDKIEKYLDELSEEYKDLLFKALVEKSDSLENLSVSELLRIDAEIKKPLIEDNQLKKKRMNTFRIVGALYVLIGLFSFALYLLNNQVNSMYSNNIFPLLSITISFIGALFMLLSTIQYSPKKLSAHRKGESVALLKYEVISKWRDLEGITLDLSEGGHKKSIAPYSVITYLLNNRLIDETEARELKEFLKMRNDIVHSSSVKYSPDQIQVKLNYVEKIIKKLSKII